MAAVGPYQSDTNIRFLFYYLMPTTLQDVIKSKLLEVPDNT